MFCCIDLAFCLFPQRESHGTSSYRLSLSWNQSNWQNWLALLKYLTLPSPSAWFLSVSQRFSVTNQGLYKSEWFIARCGRTTNCRTIGRWYWQWNHCRLIFLWCITFQADSQMRQQSTSTCSFFQWILRATVIMYQNSLICWSYPKLSYNSYLEAILCTYLVTYCQRVVATSLFPCQSEINFFLS